jgi:hypothetical protein
MQLTLFKEFTIIKICTGPKIIIKSKNKSSLNAAEEIGISNKEPLPLAPP